jgi:predicted secreted protein
MNPASVIVVFVIVWWLVLFMVLPWGVKPDYSPKDGNMAGSPKNPNIAIKMLVTTIIAAIITGGYFYATESGLIVFVE